MMQGAWGWCTGMTQRYGIGREVGGWFKMGNTCTPVVDLCQCGGLFPLLLFYFIFGHAECGILVPQPGIEPLALGSESSEP